MVRILVVEDDVIQRQALDKVLKDQGYDVWLASDGQEGLRRALIDHPDLVLVDILMPVMDGITMVEKIRADSWGESVPIIILSNLDPSEDIVKGFLKSQPIAYMLKAYSSLEDVVKKIKEMLGT